MNAQELINYIATAPKKTPVKLYVKEKAPIDYGSARVFGAGDRIVFGDWSELGPILEQNRDSIEDIVIENDRRNSAVPLLDMKGIQARIEPGALIRENVSIGNGAVIIPNLELAISAKSAARDQAWDFIKYVLADDDIMNSGWQFSISKSAMNELYAKSEENYGGSTILADDDVAVDEEGNAIEPEENDPYAWMREEGYSEDYINYQKNSNRKYDQAAVDYIRGIVENATKIARTDSSLVDIVREDLSAVFAGAKSAEDAAKQIASRVGIYVSEHS